MKYWLIILTLLFSFSSDAQMRRRVHAASGPAIPDSLRPISDMSNSGWGSTASDLFTELNEVVADDDATEISSGVGGADCIIALGVPVVTPTVNTGHVLHIRYKMNGSCGVELLLYLYGDGLVFSASLATVTGGWTEYVHTLSSGEVAAITDYSAISIEITSTGIGCDEYYEISQVYLEVPGQ